MEFEQNDEPKEMAAEIDPTTYLLNKRELFRLYQKSGIYEYWGKPNEWDYHELFEYTNSCYEGLKGELGLKTTYIYFPETSTYIADCDSFETHNYIQLSTGMFEKFLEIPILMKGVHHAFPGLVDLYNEGKIPPIEYLVFLLGISGLIFHEIGHAAQFQGPRKYSDEVQSKEKDKTPLTREKVIEHHLSEWDADNFSSVLSSYQIFDYVDNVENEDLKVPLLEEFVTLAMIGKFLVHNALSGDQFKLYYLEGEHPCAPMRITNYCSRITSFLKILEYEIDENYCVSLFAGVLDNFGKGNARASFMESMKSTIGNDYFEIIQQEREKSTAKQAFARIIEYATKIEVSKRSKKRIAEDKQSSL